MTTDDEDMRLRNAAVSGNWGFHGFPGGPRVLTEAEVEDWEALVEKELARRWALVPDRRPSGHCVDDSGGDGSGEWLLFECDAPGCKAAFTADMDKGVHELEARGWTSTEDGPDLCPLHRGDSASRFAEVPHG
jgi:hypothetical protein